MLKAEMPACRSRRSIDQQSKPAKENFGAVFYQRMVLCGERSGRTMFEHASFSIPSSMENHVGILISVAAVGK
jgi:hypothetical protein